MEQHSEFQKTESITRSFTTMVVVTSLFFATLLGGLYLSSRSVFNSLTTLSKVNQMYDLTRQIGQLRLSFSEILQGFSAKSNSIQSVSLFKMAIEQDDLLFAKGIELSKNDSDLSQSFIQARDADNKFKESLNKLMHEQDPAGADVLFTKQFELESNELLTKAQIALKTKSDQLFVEVYERRFQPLLVVVGLVLIFMSTTLFMGLRIARRFKKAISEFLNATTQVASGNLDFQAQIFRHDEVGQLTNAFNEMVVKLKEITVSKDSIENVNVALAAANKELEAFSYSVSHDLRAPLRGIDGFSQMLLEDLGPKLDGESKNYLNRIRSGVQRMGHLIDDMLNLSKLSRTELTLRPMDLSAVAKDIFEEFKKEEPTRDVEFVLRDHLKANVDPALLRILLENLIGNAWKYTSKVAHARIEIGLVTKEDRDWFFIKDNGAGFDMAYAKKLFGVFQRLHRDDEFPGTGVGLATVQRILHRHGGAIIAQGEVDKGATFFFHFGAG